MPIRLTSLRHHRWLAILAVLAFALRALIPAGFMPVGNGALTLQVCPDGFPAALLDHSAHAGHHHHHAGDGAPDAPVPHDHHSWTSGHCVFSAVAGAPPLSHAPIVSVAREIWTRSVAPDVVPVSLDTRFRIAQPRAPPHLV